MLQFFDPRGGSFLFPGKMARRLSGVATRAAAAVALLAGMTALHGAAHAQADYPNKPITWVIAYPPGGGTDAIARKIAAHVQETLGQPIIIESKPGAEGVLAMTHVAKAKPDGYTFLLANQGMFVHNVGMRPSMTLDPAKDFAAVAMVCTNSFLIVAGPATPANTIQELAAEAKAAPGQVKYANTGVGVAIVAMEMLKKEGGFDIPGIGYPGAAPAAVDIQGGHIQLGLFDFPPVKAGLDSKALKPLAVTSKKRWTTLPDVPTIDETILAGYEAENWNGFFAPAGTPASAVDKMNEAIGKALDTEDVKKFLSEFEYIVLKMSPGDMQARLEQEIATFTPIITSLGLKSE